MSTATRPPGVRATIHYGFATGKVRVLESRLFARGMYERLLDAPTFADQRRILSDTPYGRYLDHVDTAEGVQRALAEALDGFYRFLDESKLPAPVTRFFRVRHDFESLRGALKARVLGTAQPAGTTLGTLPADSFAGPLDELPEPFGPLAARAADRGGEADGTSEALASIDELVDSAMFAEFAKCAEESRSEFLEGLARAFIDTANARMLVRAKRAGRPAAAAVSSLIGGGALTSESASRVYALPPADLAEELAGLPGLAGVPAAELADPRRLDIAIDNAVVRYLSRARLVSVGPEPVIAYVSARESEVAAVRTVLVGKLSGLAPDLLRARLREMAV